MRFQSQATIQSTSSPSRMRPVSSAKIARSASPSNATPSAAPSSRVFAAIPSGWRAPQSRLMLRPSGASWIAVTRAPARWRARGPIWNAAPLPASRSTGRPVEVLRHAGLQTRDVSRDEARIGVRRRGRGLGRSRCPSGFDELLLEVLLFGVGPLAPVGAEDLDAVVLVGIVRGRDRDTGRRADLEDELRDAGGRDDARRGDAAPALARARRRGRRRSRGVDSRVSPPTTHAASSRDPASRRAELAPEQAHRGRIERELACLAAQSVGSEEFQGRLSRDPVIFASGGPSAWVSARAPPECGRGR